MYSLWLLWLFGHPNQGLHHMCRQPLLLIVPPLLHDVELRLHYSESHIGICLQVRQENKIAEVLFMKHKYDLKNVNGCSGLYILSCGETTFSLIPLLQLPFSSAQHVKTYREYQTTWDHSWTSFRTLLMWLYVTHDQEIFKLSTHVHPITRFCYLCGKLLWLAFWRACRSEINPLVESGSRFTCQRTIDVYGDHPTRKHLR